MRIGNWKNANPTAEHYGTLRELGLEPNVAELDAFGFTVVPPEKAGTPHLASQLLARLQVLSAERNGGVQPDLETGATHLNFRGPGGQSLFYLMAEGREFEAALMNPVVQAFARYMLGDALILSSASSTFKGPGKLPFFMHSDQPIHPIPRSLVCNVTYLLTDYSRENGALCFVPGSHLNMRQPLSSENFGFGGIDPREAMEEGALADAERAAITEAPGIVPVEAPAGSLVVWHGNTWHGAYPRSAPGLRVNLVLFFCVPWLRPQEAYREYIPDEVLARNDDRFAALMGRNVHFGWQREGPDRRPGIAFARYRQRARESGGVR
jgi:ectoine hydroxylase-related dioxygenase (phytanoyl-CoA dioxygenase family)